MADPEEHWSESGTEVERTVFFSDAVFAIAITLLALNIRVPNIPAGAVADQLPRSLVALFPRIYSFVLSFWIIGLYWITHHRIFHYIKCYDRRLLLINFLFLMWIVLMPFSASLLGEYGEYQLPMIVYSSHMILASLSLSWLWWYACRDRKLVDPDIDSAVVWYNSFRVMVLPVVFLAAIGISFVNVSVAQWSLLLLFFVRPAIIWYTKLRRTA